MPAPGNPQSLNRYAYVYNNPLRYTDPSGHDPRLPQENDSVLTYIVREMHLNTQSEEALAIRSANNRAIAFMGTPPLQLVGGYHQVNAYRLWIAQVNTGMDWDHKSVINSHDWVKWSPGDGEYVQTWIWSNMHYGFVGHDLGFSDCELLWGAGIAQAYLELLGKRDMKAAGAYVQDILAFRVGLHTYLDNPGDSNAIRAGIWLRQTYGPEITEEQLIEALYQFGLVRRRDE